MTIREEANNIVHNRVRQYDGILADLYYMAATVSDYETQQGIWEEAWVNGNTHLLALLLLTETPFLAREHYRKEETSDDAL